MKKKLFKIKPLSYALKSALYAAAGMMAFNVASIQAAEEDEAASDDNKIIVTGSRLSRTDVEGAAPVHIITAEEIEANGFTTAFEALKALTQVNGSNQGAQDGGTFTQGADSLNLRSFGAGRTLTLVNGRRMADYPLPFNGQSNIVNVANIPSVMIERIEVLSSGASAIYGSDAIAGVFNIILKDEVDGLHATARFGDTSDGGGESYRFQLVGGHQTDKLNMVYGLELFNREPIMASDRDYMDSILDNPDVINGISTPVNSRSFLVLDPFDIDGDGSRYIDPGQATCDTLSHLANGTIEYSTRPGAGNFCGTAYDIGFSSIRNAKDNVTGYLNLSYELNSSHELFATMVVTDSRTEFNTGTTYWAYSGESGIGDNYFLNSASPDLAGIGGRPEYWQRLITPEETSNNDNRFSETAIDITIGANGEFFGGFDYEASLSISQYDLTRKRRLIDAATADAFFLGAQQGTANFGQGTWNVFNADISRLYQPLTTAEYDSITGIDKTTADSKNVSTTLVLTNEDIFEMPAGSAGLALVVEAATQEYEINLDPKLINGEWFGFTGTGGGGERDRYALGAEFKVPLTEDLQATFAARWDKYDDETNVDDATTFNIGLEYRPIESLLIRGSYSTSFRAPDMHYVYAAPSGYFANVTDQYLCRRDQLAEITLPNGNLDYNLCTLNASVDGVGLDGTYNIEGARQGSTFLEEEEGESATIGFVFDFTDDMSLTVDYYQIKLENAVRDRSRASLLEVEADCRLGVTTGGNSVDINSAECQNVLSLITRNTANGTITQEFIDSIVTGPINAALRETSGFDVAYNYRLVTDSIGDFAFRVNYNITDSDEDQQFAGDEVRDRRHHKQFFDFRSQVNVSANWKIDDWSTTLFAHYTGSVPNWAETDRCCEVTTYNLSVAYQATDDLKVGLFVKNLLDENPQQDSTFNTYPYYQTGQYDGYGREYSLQFDYAFGE
ncbi:TonB-dependent receptor plug domain-containing protein [Aliikangiella coralliicola]|uniref:TonB-dependent receptor n=1 Tax=Aliikangiella coralliicola TaxID=2592383 RepID=A0A545U7M5_9GAMM|nr:TonB-dependent receptor [Aliikangiella coralliicola]TQV85472.1 TonB-dependent receptor [Aliikangiella coralliicola]